MTHVVDQIAEKIVSLLLDGTDAEQRVSRDRNNEFEAKEELPAIDIRIGADNPVDGQVANRWRSDVQINVDLYTVESDDRVSAALLELRRQADERLMAEAPILPGMASVIRIQRGGAEEILRGESSRISVGYLRTVYFVLYQHSLTSPT